MLWCETDVTEKQFVGVDITEEFPLPGDQDGPLLRGLATRTVKSERDSARAKRQPRNVRLPVFVSDDPVGLGDVIKRATSTIGIKPCGGCAERAQRLNRRMTFTGRKR
jgi:hypothetical protein